MDTEHLKVFDRVVREGGFSRAAWSLDLAQATVSARIQSLEQEIGGELFVRGRRIKLTPRGETFLEYVRRALNVLNEGVEAASSAAGEATGRISIGVAESLSGVVFAKAVEAFHAEQPQATIKAITSPCDQIVQMVRDGVVCFGLIPWPLNGVNDLKSLWTFRESVLLVAHPKHVLSKRKTVVLADVSKLANPYYPLWFDEPSDALLAPLARIQTSRLELPMQSVLALLRKGVGAAFLTSGLVIHDIELGNLKIIKVQNVPKITRGCALVCRKNSEKLNDDERLFAAIAKKTIVTR
jgi:LysR family transcriptional regulator, low CO2-responsive transcriptional regulator